MSRVVAVYGIFAALLLAAHMVPPPFINFAVAQACGSSQQTDLRSGPAGALFQGCFQDVDLALGLLVLLGEKDLFRQLVNNLAGRH